jgi:hypothetical protein
MRAPEERSLCDNLERASASIQYRSPPPKKPVNETPAIEVRVPENVGEFKECLALRYRVYTLLGYISEDQASGDLDLDFFDPSAVHFIAVEKGNRAGDARIAGTARLLVTRTSILSGGLFGGTGDHFKRLCDQVAATSPRLRRNLDERPVAAALPVLAALKLTPEEISEDEVCELSRVVVSEEFRGLGLSRLLVRACIAAALDLRLRVAMLECLPEHVPMYAKFDFARTSSLSPRPWGIDHEPLTAMRLDLHNSDTEAVMVANRDIQMMREPRWLMPPPRGLCLCENTACWRNGLYYDKHSCRCPLNLNSVPMRPAA